MEQINRVGYSSACCALSIVRAACRALVKKCPVSVVDFGTNGPRVFVTCTRKEPDLVQYIKRDVNGILIRATAVYGDTPGVDLAIGEGIALIKGLPAISPALLSLFLSSLAEESRGQSVRVVLSADAEELSLLTLPEVSLQQKEKKTLVVLLGEQDDTTVSVLKTHYGAEAVRSAGSFRRAVPELLKSAVLNILFAGKLGDVAAFLGIHPREATHLLGYFESGKSGFLFASSPILLDRAENKETLSLLQTLSNEHAKTGILITRV